MRPRQPRALPRRRRRRVGAVYSRPAATPSVSAARATRAHVRARGAPQPNVPKHPRHQERAH
eukprot:scaffold82496_cov29-Tisochrysis_lutea.AAC.6